MKKSELMEALAQRVGITNKQAKEIVSLIFDSMTESLKDGGRIEIRGFGSFVKKSYGPYVGRNPKTGEAIHVKAKRLPFFKTGKELRERIDSGD